MAIAKRKSTASAHPTHAILKSVLRMTPVHATRASSNFSNSYEFASHTSACMHPFARQLFGWQADNPERRAAALVLEVKGDFLPRHPPDAHRAGPRRRLHRAESRWPADVEPAAPVQTVPSRRAMPALVCVRCSDVRAGRRVREHHAAAGRLGLCAARRGDLCVRGSAQPREVCHS